LDTRFATVGEHTLQLQGVALDGFIKAANLGVSVQEGSVPADQNARGISLWVLVAIVVIVMLILVLSLFARRRSRV